MELKGFNENELSAQNKAALQSETWKEVRKAMRTEPQHFTAEKADDNSYGWTWNQVVQEYLRTGYKGESSDFDITVQGVTYKALRRTGVTVFYDADGNTLFDVSHERLEKEYEWLMGSGAGDVAQNMDTEEEEDIDGEDNPIMEQAEADTEICEAPSTERAEEEEDITDNGADDHVIPMGTASLKEIVAGLSAPTAEEIAAAKEENAKPVKQRAKEKLEKERESAKDSTFADPIIGYLLKRCEEDEGLSQDVIQEHKTWQKCFDYIYSRARKQSKGNCAFVRDEVVYEWAEEYYHKDDKTLAASKTQKTAEDKAKKGKPAAVNKASIAKGSADNVSATPKAVPAKVTQEQPRPKRNSKDMDGQMDMFSMMMI